MTTQSAQILIDSERTIGEISPLLFGGFAEHMGRCIYEGIYEPGSPFADEDGIRTDVLDALREHRYRVMRYPGGNFVSGYNWLDGVGPKEKRPRRRELAWQSYESNQFGTNEFIDFCRKLDTLPMLAVNLGTGTIQSAADLVEYCNVAGGSYFADLRASHGYKKPHDVKYWCLGNEVDGPWQIAHQDAVSYGRKALEAAKLMRRQDPDLKLILCGSSSDRMPTYPEWDRTVLEIALEQVDYISMHLYPGNHDNDSASYLASAVRFEEYVDTMAGTIRYVQAKKRSKRQVYLSWDEWQAFSSNDHGQANWQEAPHIAEIPMTLEDALVVAQWLNVFLRKCDVLKIGCMAQVVNVVSWLLTRRDGLLKQTSFYPFVMVSNHARGQSLDLVVKAPQIETKQFGNVPVLDVSASHDPESGAQAFFIVNRSLTETITTELVWQQDVPLHFKEAWRFAGNDVKATNSWENPRQMVTQKIDVPAIDAGRATLQLPPLSFTALAT